MSTIHTTRPYPSRPIWAEPTDTVVHVDRLPDLISDPDGPLPLMPTTEAPQMPRYVTVLAPLDGYMLCEVSIYSERHHKATVVTPAVIVGSSHTNAPRGSAGRVRR